MEGKIPALPVSLVLILLFSVTDGGEFCQLGSVQEYCLNGCCSVAGGTICCLSPYTIVGIIFGCISVISALGTVIFCLCQRHKRAGRILNYPAHTIAVNNSSYPAPWPPGHPETQPPLPPGYAPHYNSATYLSGLPPYSNGRTPPPPYTYSHPNTSAFLHASSAAHKTHATHVSPFATAAAAAKDTNSLNTTPRTSHI